MWNGFQDRKNNLITLSLLLFKQIKMLRRPATTIKLTPEDVLEYDDSLLNQQNSQHHFQQLHDQNHNDFTLQEQMNTNIHNNSSSEIATKEQSKDDRIGATRNN